MPIISGLTAIIAADVVAADLAVIFDTSAAKAKKITASDLRTALFAGTGMTASDPLVCGTINASGNITGTLATASQPNITTCANLVTVGALNAGSITSGFGSIDIGADALTAGAISGTEVETTGGFVSRGLHTSGNTASKIVVDWNATARLISYGADGSTNGTFQFLSRRSDATNSINILTSDTAGNVTLAGGSGSLTAGAASFTTGAFSSLLTVAITAASNRAALFKAPNNQGTAVEIASTDGGQYNWQIGANTLAINTLTFTPSTATTAGAATFTTPVLSLSPTALTVGSSTFVVTAATGAVASGRMAVAGSTLEASAGFCTKSAGDTNATAAIVARNNSGTAAFVVYGDLSGYLGGALAITGALTGVTTLAASGTITSTVGNGGGVLIDNSATTGNLYGYFSNTSGKILWAVEGSAAGALVVGSEAYASLIGSVTAKSLQLFTNNTVALTLASTGAATFAGTGSFTSGVSIGSAVGTAAALEVIQTASQSGNTQHGAHIHPTFSSAVTATGVGVFTYVSTAAASFTLTDGYGIYIGDASKGAGSTITNQYGIYIANQTKGATLNYAIYSAGGRVRLALPTSSAGLASGDLYANSGVVTVVP